MASAASDRSTAIGLEAVAWLYSEIEQVLTQTQKTLRSRLRVLSGERKPSQGTEQSALADLQKRLGQSINALGMVNVSGAVQMLVGITSAVKYISMRPEALTEKSANTIDHACFALLDFLQHILKGKTVQPIGLFPQYHDVVAIAKQDALPADLWEYNLVWADVDLPKESHTDLEQDDALSHSNVFMLSLLRGKLEVASDLKIISLNLAYIAKEQRKKQFWSLVAGFFDGIASKAIAFDLYTKRVASQVLHMHKAYTQGELKVSDEFAKNLLFFCADHKVNSNESLPATLAAVIAAYELKEFKWVDYNEKMYGRIDPALISLAQKRISIAKAAWSSFSSGEPIQAQSVITSISNVTELIKQIIPASANLADTLLATVTKLAQSNTPPSPDVALEVATTVLYLEATFSNLDLDSDTFEIRFVRLTERLSLIVQGGKPMPLDSWIEDLYQHINDHETMESVVSELHAMLYKVEKQIDGFLRKNENSQILAQAAAGMQQMYSVLSVLGLDEAARAIATMKDQVQWLLKNDSNTSESVEAERSQLINSLSNSLGVFGFLVNMLGHQPLIARELFIFDEDKQELTLLMGRNQEQDVLRVPANEASKVKETLEVSDTPETDHAASTKPLGTEEEYIDLDSVTSLDQMDRYPESDFDDEEEDDSFGDDLRDIFLEEAHEVIETARGDLKELRHNPANRDAFAAVRRSFHTLKGSSRMVGLMAYGEAAWAAEQCLNEWLTVDTPASDALLGYSDWALRELEAWASDLQAGEVTGKNASIFEEHAKAAMPLMPVEKPSTADSVIIPDIEEPALESGTEVEPKGEQNQQPIIPFDLSDIDLSLDPEAAILETDLEDSFNLDDDQLELSDLEDIDVHSHAIEGEKPKLELAPPLENEGEDALDLQEGFEESSDSIFPATEMLPDDTLENAVKQLTPVQDEEIRITDEEIIEELDQDLSEPMSASSEELVEEHLDTTQTDDIKIIGSLKVDRALYDIYVEEANVRAEKLKRALLEWQTTGELEPLDNAQILAHAMAGSSFTVGFNELAELAKSLENNIEHYRQYLDENNTPSDRSASLILWKAGEEIHRLLNLFIQGSLASPQPEIVDQLEHFNDLSFEQSIEVKESLEPEAEDMVSPDEAIDIIDMPDTSLDDGFDEFDTLEVIDQDAPESVMDSIYPETSLDSIYPEATETPEISLDVASENETLAKERISAAAASALAQLLPSDRDAISPELFEFFKDETQELLPRVSEGLRNWSHKPPEKKYLNEVLRILHTLKGNSRLAGAMRLANMIHELEAKVESMSSGENITPQQTQNIIYQADDLSNEFDLLCMAADELAQGLVNIDDLPDLTKESFEVGHEVAQEKPSKPALEGAKKEVDISSESELVSVVIPEPPILDHTQSAFYRLSPSDQGAISSDLFNIFKDEALGLLARIGKGLREWSSNKDAAINPDVSRALHTLKGSARLTGTMRLATMVHELESTVNNLDGLQVDEQNIQAIEDQFMQIEGEFELLSQAAKEVEKGLLVAPKQPLYEGETKAASIQSTSALMALDAVDRAIVGSDVFSSFNEEVPRQIKIIAAKLHQWQQQPEYGITLVEVLQALNVIRDNIRLAGISRLNRIVQELDAALRVVIGTTPSQEQIEHIHRLFTAVDVELGLLSSAAQEILNEQQAKAAEATAKIAAEQESQEKLDSAQGLTPRTVKPTAARPLASASSGQMIRVRAALIDELVTKSGEVNMIRGQLAGEARQLKDILMSELSLNLERLRGQLRDIEIQAETQMTSRMDAARAEGQAFDPLEFDRYTRIQELTRMMAESVNDVGTVQKSLMEATTAVEDGLAAQSRSARDIQHTLLRARMVDFSSTAERFHRVVRLAAKECEKNAKLTIIGGEIEIDRVVLDHVAPAFEHMLRNSVVHGIESPEKRIALGKEAIGEIKITLMQEGNDVSIILSDDGAGLDLNKIRIKATNIGLITPDSQISDYDLVQMIYKSGLTTTDNVTELAGRGIGLDMAYAEIAGLGGRIEVLTTPHEGTQFKLLLPLTTAVTQVALVNIADKTFGIPVSLIESIQRFSSSEVINAIEHGKIKHNDQELPAYWLGGLLEMNTKLSGIREHRLQWLVLRSAGQKIVVAVDNVIGSQEVVIKNVGPQFAHLTGFSGLTVLSGGRIVIIYNPIALARVFGEQGKLSNILTIDVDDLEPTSVFQNSAYGETKAPQSYAPPRTPHSKKVMVVDDSLTVRRVTQRFLERSGFEVTLAKDGRDALEQLNREIPALILSDIEMPRMDGFEFVRQLRSRRETENLPVIMITSRIAQKHRDYAKELGVSHYLGKPYDDEELLKLVREFVAKAP